MSRLKSRKVEMSILGVALIVVISLVAGLPFYLKGQTTTSGGNPETEQSDAATCESKLVIYPFLEAQSGEVGHKMSIKMMFQRGNVSTLGLYYNMEYDSVESAKAALNVLESSMNISLAKAGLGSGQDMNKRVYRNENNVEMSLYVSRDNINSDTAPFLMLEGEDVSIIREDVLNKYREQGFVCSENLNVQN